MLILAVRASVAASEDYLIGQVVVQVRDMYHMIDAALKSEYG